MINIEIPDGELFRGPAATLLVEMARRYIRPKKRVIAAVHCQNGGAFTVKAPVQPPQDFADAIAEVLTPDRAPTARNMADCEDEAIGDEFSTRPFLW